MKRGGGPLRVALVGAGAMGRRRALAVKGSEGSELVAVADLDLARAESLAREMGCSAFQEWEAALTKNDIDVVIVSTPTNMLAPISLAAMERGKDVLCEKPLASNPEEAKKLVEAASVFNVKLKTGFNLRYHPGLRMAKKLLDEGAIGEIVFLRCRYGHGGRPGYDREWRTDARIVTGGEMLDQGVHVVDLFRWFLGDFTKVIGSVSNVFWDIAPLEDNAFAIFQTERSQSAFVHVSWTQWKNLFSFEVFGREGYLSVEGLGGSYGVERMTMGLRSPVSGPPKEEYLEFAEEDRSCEHEWRDFVNALREGREPEANGYDGWQALRIVYAVYASAKTARAVEL